MKLSERWLREWVDPALSSHALGEQLTLAGLEVETIDPVAGDFTQVVVGEIVKAQPHPKADRLALCEVNIGEQCQQIICGDPKVAQGMKVACALPGAVLPGNFKIKPRKLRGVESQGMLCAPSELGIAGESDGIMVLPQDAPLGKALRDYLNLDDNIITIDITPNRADCFSVQGIAREVAALNNLPLKKPTITTFKPTLADTFRVTVETPSLCPRYLGCIIKHIPTDRSTPLWLADRLRHAGLRLVSPLVDITNYVMLELGQPLHAFDLSSLSGGIVVRKAQKNEPLSLLDGQSVTLNEETLIIADENNPVAIAGIMGSAATAVSTSTQDIFLESAFFTPEALAGQGRAYGIQTDSSQRFERGVDFALPPQAMARAIQLITEILGGQVGPLTEAVSPTHLPARTPILLRKPAIDKLVGIVLSPESIEKHLESLGMTVEKQRAHWLVTPPSYRFDVNTEVDLIEEIIRLYGYDNLPEQLPASQCIWQAPSEEKIPLRTFRHHLAHLGYQEVLTYSFVNEKKQAQLMPAEQSISLSNPISSEMSVMRTTLWGSLLETLAYNQNRQMPDVRIFETGLRYQKIGETILQEQMIAGLAAGDHMPLQWQKNTAGKIDFYQVNNDLRALFAATGQGAQFTFTADTHKALHPGQTALISCHGKNIGYIGALHPKHYTTFGVQGPVILFELDYGALSERKKPLYAPISKFPGVSRDIAFTVDQGVLARDLSAKIREIASPLLDQLTVFDVYQGEEIPEDKKSVAFRLHLQEKTRALADDEVDKLVTQVVEGLKKTYHVELR